MVIYKYQYYANRNLDDFSALFEGKEESKSYKSAFKKTVNDFNLNFGFIFTFGTSITAFFPIVENLIKNMDVTGADINKGTVIYLTICALAIIFKEPKAKYKKIFEELRLRGSYGFLEPLTEIFEGIKKIFNFIGKKIGVVAETIADMFGYTAMFVPFILSLADIVSQQNISLDSMVSAFTTDGWGKILSFSIGVGTFTVKNLIIELIEGLKSFRDRGIDKVKRIINKIRGIDTDKLVTSAEKNDKGGDIKKFSEFDGEEIIQEND